MWDIKVPAITAKSISLIPNDPFFCQQKVVSEKKAKNREETIVERLPEMNINNSMSDEELRNIANDVYNRLKTTLGDIFDLEEQKKKNEYYVSIEYMSLQKIK